MVLKIGLTIHEPIRYDVGNRGPGVVSRSGPESPGPVFGPSLPLHAQIAYLCTVLDCY